MLIETFEERLEKSLVEQFGDNLSGYYYTIFKFIEDEHSKYNLTVHSKNLNITITASNYNELFDRMLRMVKAWTPNTRNRTPKEESEQQDMISNMNNVDDAN